MIKKRSGTTPSPALEHQVEAKQSDSNDAVDSVVDGGPHRALDRNPPAERRAIADFGACCGRCKSYQYQSV
jgi:hypothetical protein